MVKLSVIVTAHGEHLKHLPRIERFMAQQTFRDFEVITVTSDDPASDGNLKRWLGLQEAGGEYVSWLSADNVVYPWWVEQHAANIALAPGALSIVNIHYCYSDTDHYVGVLPKGFSEGNFDLMNMAVPRLEALRIRAFDSTTWNSDWEVFNRLHNLDGIPIQWDADALPVGIHF